MRSPRTLSLYLAREIALFGGLGFAGVTTLLVSRQLLERLDRRARFAGILECTLGVFAYYCLMRLGRVVAREEWISAAAGYWTPSLAFACVALGLPSRSRPDFER